MRTHPPVPVGGDTHVNGANTRAIVLTIHSVEKMTGSDVSGLYAIAESYGITSCVTFSYPGGYSFIFSYSRGVKELFVAQ